MHPASLRNMKICVEKYLGENFFADGERKIIVDIGAMDVNGSYCQLFSPDKFEYIGIDMAPGKGVDLVISDPYRIPIKDNFADVVISGQMLEHNKFFWRTFREKIRILNDRGFCITIAPSAGKIHRFPGDYYRYYPDAYAALAEYTNSILIDCWIDQSSAWGDLVGVWVKSFRKGIQPFDTTKIKQLRTPQGVPSAAAAPGRPPARQPLEKRIEALGVRELEQLLARKTNDVELVRKALDAARKKPTASQVPAGDGRKSG